MIFIINICFYLHYITFYDCKNKHIFPYFQTSSDNCANYERFFCIFAPIKPQRSRREVLKLADAIWDIGFGYLFPIYLPHRDTPASVHQPPALTTGTGAGLFSISLQNSTLSVLNKHIPICTFHVNCGEYRPISFDGWFY